jgi:hypothetical protein
MFLSIPILGLLYLVLLLIGQKEHDLKSVAQDTKSKPCC